jgi:glutamate racemase
VGGLPYLEWVRGKIPLESHVYLADNEAFPYGEKSADELKRIVVERVGRLIRHHRPKVIVVACNTASVAALSELRDTFETPFVGVVPAVKPAALYSRAGKIGLLATNGTVSDRYTDRLIDDFASSCSVTRIADGSIVRFVEERFVRSTPADRLQAISAVVDRIKTAGVDTLVIGCTHFVYIEDDLRSALSGSVEIVDSLEGVGKQIIRRVSEAGLHGDGPHRASLLTTSPRNHDRFAAFAQRFGLVFDGTLGG